MRLAILVAAGLVAIRPAAAADTGLPGWLAGTWAMEQGAAWADEVWTTARGDLMLGLARKGFGPEVEGWETLRIVRKAGGAVVYVMQAKGGAAVEFPLSVASAGAAEFTNPAHTFPQRIRFWREGQLLMREMSKMDGSDAVRMNFRPVETVPPDYRKQD